MKNFPVEKLVRINEFVAKLDAFVKESHKANGYAFPPSSIEMEPGKKFVKIVKRDYSGSRYVHSFIDIESGDIYKAASWKAPAKHVRGNIFADDYGIGSAVSEYGARYL